MSRPQDLIWQGASLFRGPADPIPQAPAEKVQTLADQLKQIKDAAVGAFEKIPTDTQVRDWITTNAPKAPRAMKDLLIGHPEKILEPGNETIPGPGPSSLTVPNWLSGGVDAAMALPLFGGMARGGLELAGGTIREMKPFFSQLSRTLAERLPERASTEQILNIARKGSKAEELAYSGLEDFLKPGQKYLKTDVMRHLEKNAPELHEQMIGNQKFYSKADLSSMTDDELREAVHRHTGRPLDTDEFGHPGEPLTPGDRLDLIDMVGSGIKSGPKFTNYTLPGGVNHRELMVTLPDKGHQAEEAFMNWVKGHKIETLWSNMDIADKEKVLDNIGVSNDWMKARLNNHVTPEFFDSLPNEFKASMRKDYRKALDSFSDEEMGDAALPKAVYNVPSGHAYGDPELDVNRLFHIRMNDRDNGKTLFGEEWQSDWHQEARRVRTKEIKRIMKERGLSGKEARAEVAREVPTDFGYTMNRASSGPLTDDEKFAVADFLKDEISEDDAFETLRGEYPEDVSDEDIYDEIGSWGLADKREFALEHMVYDLDPASAREMIGGEHAGGVPDAPFKQNWEELALRRLYQEAAAGGYERLAWTTGKQQADRYSLAQHGIFKLDYDGHSLRGYNRTGEPVFNQLVKPDDLDELVGDDLAEKLTDKPEPTHWDEKLAEEYNKELASWGIPENKRLSAEEMVHSPGLLNQQRHWLYDFIDRWESKTSGWPVAVEGNDLQVGGQGMIEAYDKRANNILKKISKKFGGPEPEAHTITSPGKGFKYLNTEGEEIPFHELDRMIQSNINFHNEMTAEDIRHMDHEELLNELNLDEDDFQRGGDYGDYSRYDLHKLIQDAVDDMSPEMFEDFKKEIMKEYPGTGQGDYLIIGNLTKAQSQEILTKYLGFDEEDFLSAGEYAGYSDEKLREMARDRAEYHYDAMQDLIETGDIEKVPNETKYTVHSVRLPEDVRKRVLSEGQPLFGKMPPLPVIPRANQKPAGQPEMLPAHQSTSAPRQ